MATMSVRTRDSGGFDVGTGVADVFAKAMWGDPEREMKLALNRSDLLTDEYTRRQLQANADRINALKALDEYKLSGMQGAESPIAKILAARNAAVSPVPPSPEAPVPVDVPAPVPSPRPDIVPAEAVPDQFISAFPARPGYVPQYGPEEPVPVGETDTTLSPVVTGRPDAPAPVLTQVPPVTIAGRPAGPELAVPAETALPDTRTLPEQPDIVDTSPPETSVLPYADAMDKWGWQNLPALFGYGPQSPFPSRPGGPQLPLPAQPEAPVPVSPYTQDPIRGTGVPGVPGDIPPPDTVATGPFAGRPNALPQSGPEAPVPVEPLLIPQEQPSNAPQEARPSTVPPPDPNAGIVRAGTGDMLPPDAAPGEAQVLPGPQPGTVTVHTPSGQRLDLSQEDYLAIAKGILSKATGASDLSKGTGEMAGLIGISGNDQAPAAQRQNALLYTGNLPTRDTVVAAGDTAGTDEAIRLEQAKAAAEGRQPGKLKERIQMAKDANGVERPFQVGQDANGNLTLTPIPGFGAGDTWNSYVPDQPGTSPEIIARNFLLEANEHMRRGEKLTPAQADTYNNLREMLYPRKITATTTAAGTDTADIQQPGPAGMLTPDQIAAATAAGAPAPAPATAGAGGASAAPAPQQPAPAETAPAAPAAPATGAPVEVDTSADTLVKDKAGRTRMKSHVSKVQGQDIRNYGGWWGENEKPPSTVRSTKYGSGGATVTHEPSPEGKTSEVAGDTNKLYDLLSQGVPAMKLMDSFTPGREPKRLATIFNTLIGSGNTSMTAEQAMQMFTNKEDRSFVRSMYAFINVPARHESGAAISMDELAKYRMRFAQPSGQAWRDYAETRKARIDAIRGMRKSLNGQIGAKQLRDLDMLMATVTAPDDPTQGVDLDWTPDDMIAEAERLKKGGGGGGASKGDDNVWREN